MTRTWVGLIVIAGAVGLSPDGAAQPAQPAKKTGFFLDIVVVDAGPPTKAVVHDVTPRGLGAQLGLAKGDVLLAVNNKNVPDRDRFVKLLSDTTSLTIYWRDRDGTVWGNTVSTYVTTNDKKVETKHSIGRVRQAKTIEEIRRLVPYDGLDVP